VSGQMASVVVPFRGTDPKRRLDPLLEPQRLRLALAMLGDVVEAAAALGPVFVAAPDEPLLPAELDQPDAVTWVPDPHRGQGAAVRAGLDAALTVGAPAPYLVVNADLPCVTPRDLLALAGAVPDAGLALAAAPDGTTNALALAEHAIFEPCYGPGSATRFAALAPSRLVDAPNLMDDVDTLADLARLAGRLGSRTRRVHELLRVEAA
jgi:2-phospho-L-lactate/phosphoenolpyruvate guanylyltransferase